MGVAASEQLSEYEHLFRAREEYLRLRAASELRRVPAGERPFDVQNAGG
jgi:hypothetical protein